MKRRFWPSDDIFELHRGHNTEVCGYDGEDCMPPNCPVDDVEHLGDGVCNEDVYNTPQCGHDAGDCNSIQHFSECDEVDDLLGLNDIFEQLGNGFGDGLCNIEYNTPQSVLVRKSITTLIVDMMVAIAYVL